MHQYTHRLDHCYSHPNPDCGNRHTPSRNLPWWARAFLMTLVATLSSGSCFAEEWVALELYVSGDESDAEVQRWAASAVSERKCVSLRVYDLSAEDGGRERFERICSYYQLDGGESVPLMYGCGVTVRRPQSEAELVSALNEMLTVTVFVRSGCPICARARRFFEPLMRKYPGFDIEYRDIARDRQASRDMQEIARRYRQSAVSVPVFHFCNQVIVGFDRESTTGRRLESALDHWTFTRDETSWLESPVNSDRSRQQALPARHLDSESKQSTIAASELLSRSASPRLFPSRLPVLLAAATQSGFSEAEETDTHGRDPPTGDESETSPPPLPLPGPPPLPLPPNEPLSPSEASEDGPPAPGSTGSGGEPLPAEDVVHVPWYGDVSASEFTAKYGLPIFTIVIGLIDGFNPCAMWVLLFLLSILVNLKSRWKIFAVAGTFVFISGLAYFAFMAAWLTVWGIIDFLKPAQIILGLLAVGIGVIHVKDFFAFKRGVSLSIPESAKPGIYGRVRRIVMAENLWGAIAGASVLAVLVNIIELLCTAGLPAIYTKVLSDQGLVAWREYAYLGLYNLAYMFDDGLMVALVVITLGSHRLQERGGRWLKLVSGVVVLALGLVLLFAPEVLQFELE